MNTCHTSFSYILWAYSEHIMCKWSKSEHEWEWTWEWVCMHVVLVCTFPCLLCHPPLLLLQFYKKMWYLSVPPFLESLRLVKLGFKSGITGARRLQLCFPWIQHQCVPGFLSQMKSTTHFKLGELRKLMMAVLQHPARGITHTPVLQEQARLHVPTRCFCISDQHLRQYPLLAPSVRYPHMAWGCVRACVCVWHWHSTEWTAMSVHF